MTDFWRLYLELPKKTYHCLVPEKMSLFFEETLFTSNSFISKFIKVGSAKGLYDLFHDM